MAYYFDESYYLAAKLAQLKSVNERDPNTGQYYTEEGLSDALRRAGLTPQEHFERYGRFEGINPNQYFNEVEYLLGKLRQLQSTEPQNNWTLEKLNAALDNAGLTPLEHYERHGAFETDAAGKYINPSNAFDTTNYYLMKLDMCQQVGETVNGKEYDEITLEDLAIAFKTAALSPVTHYVLYGANEPGMSSPFLVQPVPEAERVPSDPVQERINDIMIMESDYFPPISDVDSLDNTSGPDYTLERGDVLYFNIHGTVGDDRLTIEYGAMVGGHITGGNGNDTITIDGKVSGGIYGGDGNDNITINGKVNYSIFGDDGNDNIIIGNEAKLAGFISGGLGADFIDLGGNSSGLKVAIDKGDSGTYLAPASGPFDASLCDVITGISPGTGTQLQLSGVWAAGGALAKASAFIPAVADNSACWITGNYDSAAKAFTAAEGGNDGLLVYDADAGVGVTAAQAVVLVGVDSAGATVIEGGLAFNIVFIAGEPIICY